MTLVLLGALITLAAQLIEGTPGNRARVVIDEDLQCSDCVAFAVRYFPTMFRGLGVEFRRQTVVQ